MSSEVNSVVLNTDFMFSTKGLVVLQKGVKNVLDTNVFGFHLYFTAVSMLLLFGTRYFCLYSQLIEMTYLHMYNICHSASMFQVTSQENAQQSLDQLEFVLRDVPVIMTVEAP